MSLISAIAIFFITWWVCLFIVLPIGVRSAHETGETVGEGHDTGAPSNPMLGRKMIITTLLAAVIFAVIYGQVSYGWIGFEDIPFVSRMTPP